MDEMTNIKERLERLEALISTASAQPPSLTEFVWRRAGEHGFISYGQVQAAINAVSMWLISQNQWGAANAIEVEMESRHG